MTTAKPVPLHAEHSCSDGFAGGLFIGISPFALVGGLFIAPCLDNSVFAILYWPLLKT